MSHKIRTLTTTSAFKALFELALYITFNSILLVLYCLASLTMETPFNQDIVLLQSRLNLLWTMFRLPHSMLHHGLTLLRRSVIVTNQDKSVRFDTSASHRLEAPFQCSEMVYILAKSTAYDRLLVTNNILSVPSSALIYAGQTASFRSRESHRKGPMKNSQMKFCISHNMSQYQKDCLESVLIGYLLVKFGLQCVNYSVYPRFVYTDSSQTIDLDDVQTHQNLTRRSTYGLLRRLMIVASAPPEYLFISQAYQDALAVTSSPTLDWDWAVRTSSNVELLWEMLVADSGETPVFIDHYPEIDSPTFRKTYMKFSKDYIMDSDEKVKISIKEHGCDVVLMLGSRPTFLSTVSQNRRYLSSVCGSITIHWLDKERCAMLMWWPHTGVRAYSSVTANARFPRIFQLLCHKLRLLLWRLSEEPDGPPGVPFSTATEIINYIEATPLSIQLREELYQLVSHWRSKNESIVDLECSFNLEPVDEQSYNVFEDPEDEELQCLPTQLEPLLPQESLGKLQRDWALEKEEWATVHSLRRMSNFETLSEEERANVILETKQEFVDTKMKQWLAKRT